jgi:alpha/beta superfamily hydrolase
MIPPRAEPVQIQGPAGVLESLVEDPAAGTVPAACLVACHPHPLHGGTMHNKVVATLARTANDLGMPALRFNFRGVGGSAGSLDDGRGEVQDALAAVAFARARWPGAALWLAGFSFGGHVALKASTDPRAGEVARLLTVAPALMRYYGGPDEVVPPVCPWLVVQGDADEVIDAPTVIDWCGRIRPAPQLEVLPGVGHFFHGQLNVLKDMAARFLG